jgi:hypothetical protein
MKYGRYSLDVVNPNPGIMPFRLPPVDLTYTLDKHQSRRDQEPAVPSAHNSPLSVTMEAVSLRVEDFTYG